LEIVGVIAPDAGFGRDMEKQDLSLYMLCEPLSVSH
jgi:hypothetical protein